jgi:serine/threonine-protein kinase
MGDHDSAGATGGLTPERWRRIKEILGSALERAADARESYVAAACAGDAQLEQDVRSLLAADAAPTQVPRDPGGASAPAVPPRLAAGERVGPYEVRCLLGAGGMGEVYRAFDPRLDREVALKVLGWSARESAERRERFHREARAMAALSHPNVVPIYDTGEFGDVPYLVCELFEGETLRDRLRNGPLAPPRALRFAAGIARGLAAAHERGVVHRDLKPENIFITRDEQVKILDFGLAKLGTAALAASSAAGDTPTLPGTVMGTPTYMSPEQVQGREADHRSDIFALGAILCEMLAGRRAFARDTAGETMAAILRDDPFVPDRLPPVLDLVVRRCLEKRPEERFQSARDLAFELDLLAGEPAPRPRPSRPEAAERSLLVLPFGNQARDPEADYLSESLTETLINNLSQLPGLRVLARATAFRFRDSAADPLQVGRTLDVDCVVTGRVLQVGDRLVIRAELMRVDDGSQLWGQQYDRRRGDVLTVQDEIGRAITGALRLRLSPDDVARLDRRHSRHPAAYELYLRGRYFLNKRTPAAFEHATRYFAEAVAADPGYALAHCGLADASVLLERYGARPAHEVMPRAKAAALRAMEIDDMLAEAHTSLGQVQFYYEWDPAAMERSLRRAIVLNPGYALAHHWLGFNLGEMGRIEEGLAAIEEALTLDPLSLIINTNRGTLRYFGRRFEEAVADLERTLELDPRFVVAQQWLARALDRLGRQEEALQASARALEQQPEDPECLAVYGYTLGRLGRTAEAQGLLERITAMASRRYVSPYWPGVAWLGLGEQGKALDALEEAREHRFDWLMALNVDAIFDPLREHARFRALLATLTPLRA